MSLTLEEQGTIKLTTRRILKLMRVPHPRLHTVGEHSFKCGRRCREGRKSNEQRYASDETGLYPKASILKVIDPR